MFCCFIRTLKPLQFLVIIAFFYFAQGQKGGLLTIFKLWLGCVVINRPITYKIPEFLSSKAPEMSLTVLP